MKQYITFIWNWLFPLREKESLVQRVSLRDLERVPRAKYIQEDIYSLFSYKDKSIQALIWEMKYQNNVHAYTLISPMFSDMITEHLYEYMGYHNWTQVLLVPVPITDTQRKKKGFSHIETLCMHLIPLLPSTVTYAPQTLLKTKETTSQSKTRNKMERLRNVRHSQRAQNLQGKYIILIDDVYTTGATIEESCRALYTAGAKKILTFTIAH